MAGLSQEDPQDRWLVQPVCTPDRSQGSLAGPGGDRRAEGPCCRLLHLHRVAIDDVALDERLARERASVSQGAEEDEQCREHSDEELQECDGAGRHD